MSRLVLDEVHLAWAISTEALTILLGIVEFRQRLGLQTVVMTATMPQSVARLIADRLEMKLVVAGKPETEEDEALEARRANRCVLVSQMKVKAPKGSADGVDLTEVGDALSRAIGKRIYFANTVERLQQTYDLLRARGVDMEQVTVLHNRMPRSWRADAEGIVARRFGKDGLNGDWLLLTNQVAEAGLDLSAPLVLSDPAPVDTLVQRAGRCARWFRDGTTNGTFKVITPPGSAIKEWAGPYSKTAKSLESVELALKKLKALVGEENAIRLDWEKEQEWIDAAWLGYAEQEKRDAAVEECLSRTTFALNLFDRASQQHSPGAIASTFREILSVEVAVADDDGETADAELLARLKEGQELDSSSISLGSGYGLLKGAGTTRAVRYRDELVLERNPAYLASGDLLLVPSSKAFLHRAKGLCFVKGSQPEDAIPKSAWLSERRKSESRRGESQPQSLWAHTAGVMKRVEDRLLKPGDYQTTLIRILRRLEKPDRAEEIANSIGHLAVLATGFHDLGKCGRAWQERAHQIDPDSADALIGRTNKTTKRMGVPHTPPGFFAAVAACNAATGNLSEADHLIRAIALAAARHHSSLLDPSAVRGYEFDPVEETSHFIEQVLTRVELKGADVAGIIAAAQSGGNSVQVPLMLPNDDLFPIYALVGRAILISDREDAAGQDLEVWGQDA